MSLLKLDYTTLPLDRAAGDGGNETAREDGQHTEHAERGEEHAESTIPLEQQEQRHQAARGCRYPLALDHQPGEGSKPQSAEEYREQEQCANPEADFHEAVRVAFEIPRVDADVTEIGARHRELQAMTLGQRDQLQILEQIREHRGVAADELVGLAADQEALPVEQRSRIAARVGGAEVKRHRDGTEYVAGNAEVLRTQINRKEIEWAGLGRRDGGFEKPGLIPGVGVGK